MWHNGKATKLLLLFCWSIVRTNYANAQSSNSTMSSNGCLNGGSCQSTNSDTGDCLDCLCPLGVFGSLCEKRLVTIEGDLLYNVMGIVEQLTPNSTAVVETLRTAINTVTNARQATITTVEGNATRMNIGFILFVERPSQWVDYTSIQTLVNPINTQFSSSSSVQSIFGTGSSPSYLKVQLRLNECVSNWTNCDEQANCVDLDPGFMCECNTGYTGDGVTCTILTCEYSQVPLASSQATQIVTLPNGTIANEPEENLPFGTTVIYTCPEGYVTSDASGNSLDGISLPTCEVNGWTGSRTTCGFDLGYKIAIGMAVASSFIIFIMACYFLGSYCLKAERKAKAKKREENAAGPSTVAGYDNNFFDNP